MLISPIHAYYHSIEQINGGRNDMFAAMSTVGGWMMGYFDGSSMKLWQWAKDYTLADNFFMGAFGGSYLNHQWLVCACTPVFKDAPASMQARLDAEGKLMKRPDSPSARDGAVETYSGGLGGQVTPDGYSVNTTQPPYQPSGVPPAADGSLDVADPKGDERIGAPLPPQTAKTIGDTLSAKERELGLVCRRLERGAGRRPAAAGRKALGHLYARRRGAQFPAAPPAVQLLPALRAGHARTAPSTSRTARTCWPISTPERCRRSPSTSPSARSTSIRPTPM